MTDGFSLRSPSHLLIFVPPQGRTPDEKKKPPNNFCPPADFQLNAFSLFPYACLGLPGWMPVPVKNPSPKTPPPYLSSLATGKSLIDSLLSEVGFFSARRPLLERQYFCLDCFRVPCPPGPSTFGRLAAPFRSS